MSPGVYSKAEIKTVTNINISVPKDNLITPDKVSNKAVIQGFGDGGVGVGQTVTGPHFGASLWRPGNRLVNLR